jgi:transcriptional regulator NrdR family protein
MKCPICHAETKVLDNRTTKEWVRRRRECQNCLTRFTTKEKIVLESIDKHILENYYRRLAE